MRRPENRAAMTGSHLRAMGIDNWLLRSRQKPAIVPVAPAAIDISQALYQLDTAAVQRWLADATFEIVSAVNGGPLLVIVESPATSPEADALLTSMLGAISLDLAAQRRLQPAISGESLAACTGQAQAVLLMARLAQPTDIASLAHLRRGLFRDGGTGLTVAVTIHPHDLLQNAAAKRPAWEDLKRIKSHLDELQR